MDKIRYKNGNYTKHIDTFLFRRSWREMINSLSDEQAGKLLKAIYAYTDGEKMELPQNVQKVFSIMAKQINYSARKFVFKISGVYSENND